MRTTIDAAGRIVIPKALRDRLGLSGGEPLKVTERDGRIEIEPASTPMTLVGVGDDVVAQVESGVPPLTDDTVRRTIEQTRR